MCDHLNVSMYIYNWYYYLQYFCTCIKCITASKHVFPLHAHDCNVIDEPGCLLWALGGTPANARAEKFSSLLNGSDSMCMVQSHVPVFKFAYALTLKQSQIWGVSSFLSSNGSIISYWKLTLWGGYMWFWCEFVVVTVVCLPTISGLIRIYPPPVSSKQILQHRPGTSSGSGWVSCVKGIFNPTTFNHHHASPLEKSKMPQPPQKTSNKTKSQNEMKKLQLL